MRIAFVSFDSGEYAIRLASALSRSAEICLMLPEQEAADHLQWLEPAVCFQPFKKPRLRQPLKQIRMVYHLLRRIKALNPDVIHLQHGYLWFNPALVLLRRYPLVITIKDPRFHVGDKESQKTPQAIIDFGFHRADHLIVHNQTMKQVVIDLCQVPEAIVHVIPLIQRGDDQAQPHIQEDGNLILFFGRIWAYKGLEYLIRAEPLITAQIPDARIVIAGQGEAFARYRRMMVHPEKFIVHNEYVSNEKRAELFRRASVVVLPYIEATQSGVIPVAYTHQKPVVATAVGGLPEQIEDGQTGYLVPPHNVEALADAIIRLMRDPALRRHLGTQGKRKADTEWSAEAVAEKILPVYRCAINHSDDYVTRKP